MKDKEARQEAERILRQSLQKMLEGCPDGLKGQLDPERLSEELNGFIAVQGQGENPVMGWFEVNLNPIVTIKVLPLVIFLTEELNKVLSGKPEYDSLSVVLCVCAFVATLLNTLGPRDCIEMDALDAKVYCTLLNWQKERPVNEAIAYGDVVNCIREIDGEADISRCLDHLLENRVICRSGDGFIVIREVKVKSVKEMKIF